MGDVRVMARPRAMAQTPGGEKKDESDEGEAHDGLLSAPSPCRESSVQTHGGDHNVHLGAPVATGDFRQFKGGPLQAYYGGTPSG